MAEATRRTNILAAIVGEGLRKMPAVGLPFAVMPVMLAKMASAIQMEATVGDKSPKAKERGQKQKSAAGAKGAASAKSKQDSQNRAPKIAPASSGKGKK
jgi:hypothetical protein